MILFLDLHVFIIHQPVINHRDPFTRFCLRAFDTYVQRFISAPSIFTPSGLIYYRIPYLRFKGFRIADFVSFFFFFLRILHQLDSGSISSTTNFVSLNSADQEFRILNYICGFRILDSEFRIVECQFRIFSFDFLKTEVWALEFECLLN